MPGGKGRLPDPRDVDFGATSTASQGSDEHIPAEGGSGVETAWRARRMAAASGESGRRMMPKGVSQLASQSQTFCGDEGLEKRGFGCAVWRGGLWRIRARRRRLRGNRRRWRRGGGRGVSRDRRWLQWSRGDRRGWGRSGDRGLRGRIGGALLCGHPLGL
jgi:hypothetical protein